MATTSTGNSKRLSLAIATAVAGVVLAAGISVASLLGWVKPADAGAGSGQTSIAAQAQIPANAPSTPQVVLVPVAPRPPQSLTLALNPPAGDLARPSSDSGEASRISRGEREQRPTPVRATQGERDDD
jgi:hypothetical protein